MLRTGLLIFGLLLTGAGLVALVLHGVQCGQTLLMGGAVVVIAVLCERWRYRRRECAGSEHWQRTGECFEDPETGKTVEVLYDPVSGGRRYEQVNGHLPPSKQ